MKRSQTRRAFLRAMGAGFAALPCSRLLENSVAQAAGDPVPLRFCGIYHPHGIAAEYFAMLDGRFSGLGTDTETNFNLTYSAVTQSWTGTLTIGEWSKTATASGVHNLLAKLGQTYNEETGGES